MEKKTGLTKNEGWQFGIRKTVPVKADIVWDFLFSEEGTALWLKDADREFSTFSTSSHIRTKWKLKKWTNEGYFANAHYFQYRKIDHSFSYRPIIKRGPKSRNTAILE